MYSSFAGAAKGARLLPAASVLALIAATLAFGQTPAFSIAGAPVSNQAGTAAPWILQKQSSTGGFFGGAAQAGGAGATKRRLDVNPVTGMVTSASAVNYIPLTDEERWTLYRKQTYLSMGSYFVPVFTALMLDQPADFPSQWGTGFSGLGLRVASRTGEAWLEDTLQAPVAGLLHEDVRYIASDRHGVRRALHAIAYSVLTYNNQARIRPNLALFFANYASTAVSTQWIPGKYSIARYTLIGGSEQFGFAVPLNLVQEFWPELTRFGDKIKRRL